MKRKLLRPVAGGVLALGIGMLAMPSPAAADSCSTLVCMAGMAGIGSPSGGCSGPIGSYFSIVRFNFWGYDPGRTAAARLRYLNSCSGAAENEGIVSLINAMYGEVF